MQRPCRRWRSSLLWAAGALGALVAVWLALVSHPQPLFAHSLERGPVVLYAREPLAADAGPMLDEVLRRLSRSPFYDARARHAVFLCDSRSLYRFLTLAPKGRGITSPFGNVFIDTAGVREKEGDLTYFVAHLLERRGLTAEQLLGKPLDRTWVERDLE